MFVVIVTYGNAYPNQRFASDIRTREGAEALRQLALTKGFADATIYSEEDFQAFLREKDRSRADAAAARREARELYDMREESGKPAQKHARRSFKPVRA